MKKYVALGLSLAFGVSCVQPPLPPEPPITVVISQCRGWDAGEPVVIADPTPRRPRAPEPEAPPLDPEESASLNP